MRKSQDGSGRNLDELTRESGVHPATLGRWNSGVQGWYTGSGWRRWHSAVASPSRREVGSLAGDQDH